MIKGSHVRDEEGEPSVEGLPHKHEVPRLET